MWLKLERKYLSVLSKIKKDKVQNFILKYNTFEKSMVGNPGHYC